MSQIRMNFDFDIDVNFLIGMKGEVRGEKREEGGEKREERRGRKGE